MSAMDADSERSFDVRCDRGELDVETNDFLAEGDVHGTTGEGQRYQTRLGALRPRARSALHRCAGRDGGRLGILPRRRLSLRHPQAELPPARQRERGPEAVSGDDLAAWLARRRRVSRARCCRRVRRRRSQAPRARASRSGSPPSNPWARASAPDLDVASVLADRIGTRGVHAVVGPGQLGGDGERRAHAGAGAGLGRGGRGLDHRGRARDPDRRAPEHRRAPARRRFGRPARHLRRGGRDARGARLPRSIGSRGRSSMRRSSGSPATSRPRRVRRRRRRREAARCARRTIPSASTGFDSDQPLSIHSDELEASQNGGARRLVFSKNVRVEQGDLKLESRASGGLLPGERQPARSAGGERRRARGAGTRARRAATKRSTTAPKTCWCARGTPSCATATTASRAR